MRKKFSIFNFPACHRLAAKQLAGRQFSIFNSGFTLLELLVVISIIGILISLGAVSFTTAQKKSRDARRRTDMKQIQTALELYFNDAGGYPGNINGAISYSGTPYMPVTPTNPAPADGDCPDDYAYNATAGSDTYVLTFCLGGLTGGLGPGTVTATPAGLQD